MLEQRIRRAFYYVRIDINPKNNTKITEIAKSMFSPQSTNNYSIEQTITLNRQFAKLCYNIFEHRQALIDYLDDYKEQPLLIN